MPHNGGGRGWLWDEESGQKTMPPKWVGLLDWLLQGPDREPKHQYEWAAENGIHEDSVRRIKRDVRFAREWDRRAAELNIHPERTQSVIDSLHQQAAVDGVRCRRRLCICSTLRSSRRSGVWWLMMSVMWSGLSDGELADELGSGLVAEFRGEECDLMGCVMGVSDACLLRVRICESA